MVATAGWLEAPLLLLLLPPNPTLTAAPDPTPVAGGGATAHICPHQPSSAPFVLTGLHWPLFVLAGPAGSCSCRPPLLVFT